MIASFGENIKDELDDEKDNLVVNSREIFLKSIPPQVSEHDIIEAINLKIGTDSISESFVVQRRQFVNTIKSLKITLKNPEFAKKIVDEKSLQVKDSLIEVSYFVDLQEKHADNDTSKTQPKASGQELIPPGPGNLIVSGRPLNNFSTSEDVYKVFSLFGKLSNAVLKVSKSSEKIVFLEFVNKESARQAISDLNDKPLPPELIRRLKLQTVKNEAEEPDDHYYQDTDFIGGEDFNIERIYQQDPSLAKDTLKVGYISDKKQQSHPTQTQSYEDTNQNGHKFYHTLHVLGVTALYDEQYLKEKIENIAGKDTVQFVRILNRNKNEHSFRKARVAMKKKEFGDRVIERQNELQPLKVEWFIPSPDRNSGFNDNTNPLNDQLSEVIKQMDQPLMQGSIPQGFNNNFGLSNSAPITNPLLYNMMNQDIHNIQQPSVNQGQQMFNQYGINQQQQSIQYPKYNMNQGMMGNNYSSFNQQQNPGGPQANRYGHHQQNYKDRNQYNNRQYNNNFQGNYPNQRQGGQDSQLYQKRDYPNSRYSNNQRPGQYHPGQYDPGQYGQSFQRQQQPPVMPQLFNPQILAQIPPDQQKQYIGEFLYAKFSLIDEPNAGKIVGMLLELDIFELINILGNDQQLNQKTREAQRVLREADIIQQKFEMDNEQDCIQIQQPNHPNQQINQSPAQPQQLHQQVQTNVNPVNSTDSLPLPPDLPFILPPELQFNHQINSQLYNAQLEQQNQPFIPSNIQISSSQLNQLSQQQDKQNFASIIQTIQTPHSQTSHSNIMSQQIIAIPLDQYQQFISQQIQSSTNIEDLNIIQQQQIQQNNSFDSQIEIPYSIINNPQYINESHTESINQQGQLHIFSPRSQQIHQQNFIRKHPQIHEQMHDQQQHQVNYQIINSSHIIKQDPINVNQQSQGVNVQEIPQASVNQFQRQSHTHHQQSQLHHQQQQQQYAQSFAPISQRFNPYIINSLPHYLQKQYIGEFLYSKISTIDEPNAGKITAMLLELDIGELINLLGNDQQLNQKTREAQRVLREAINE